MASLCLRAGLFVLARPTCYGAQLCSSFLFISVSCALLRQDYARRPQARPPTHHAAKSRDRRCAYHPRSHLVSSDPVLAHQRKTRGHARREMPRLQPYHSRPPLSTRFDQQAETHLNTPHRIKTARTKDKRQKSSPKKRRHLSPKRPPPPITSQTRRHTNRHSYAQTHTQTTDAHDICSHTSIPRGPPERSGRGP